MLTGLGPSFDAKDRSRETLGLCLHGDMRTAQLREQVGEAGILRDVDLKALQRLGEGILRRVRDGANTSAVLILNHDRLEDVVDLTGLEPQLGRSVAAHGAGVLEVSDTR